MVPYCRKLGNIAVRRTKLGTVPYVLKIMYGSVLNVNSSFNCFTGAVSSTFVSNFIFLILKAKYFLLDLPLANGHIFHEKSGCK
jgi:hypothetical protein